MNVLKIMFAMVIIFFSLHFILFGGWGIIALFYAIAQLIAILVKLNTINEKTNKLRRLSDLICVNEMITVQEINQMKAEVYGTKL